MITYVAVLLVLIGAVLASFYTWRLFATDHYDQQRVIDVQLIALLGGLIGGKLGHLVDIQVWNDFYLYLLFEPRWRAFHPIGIVAGVFVVVGLYTHVKKWPTIITLDRIAAGMSIFTTFALFAVGIIGEQITIYPLVSELLERRYFLIPAWLWGIVVVDSFWLWVVVLKRRKVHGSMIWLYLLSLPYLPFLLTGVGGWLIIKYNLWNTTRSKQN